MDARWVPILAAGVGIFGGVGGAYVGGSLANAGEQNRISSERRAQVQDLRIRAYGEFLQSAEQIVSKVVRGAADASLDAPFERLAGAEQVVLLVADDDAVREAASAVTDVVNGDKTSDAQQLADYKRAQTAFLEVARQELRTGP